MQFKDGKSTSRLRLDPVTLTRARGFGAGTLFAVGSIVLSLGYFGEGARKLSEGKWPKPDVLGCHPGDCWDRAMIWGRRPCTEGTGQNVLERIVPPGGRTCYKSIEYNMDENMPRLFFLIFVFVAVLARVIEHAFVLAQARMLRRFGGIALLAVSVLFFYSMMDLFFFLNEFIFSKVRTQIYDFVLTLLAVVLVGFSLDAGRSHESFLLTNQALSAFVMGRLAIGSPNDVNSDVRHRPFVRIVCLSLLFLYSSRGILWHYASLNQGVSPVEAKTQVRRIWLLSTLFGGAFMLCGHLSLKH